MQTKDFKGQDLRGKSFKNQDLTGADFSDCDLRGVDFSFANLTDAKFCNARMGRTIVDEFTLYLFQQGLGIIASIMAITSILSMLIIVDNFVGNNINSNSKYIFFSISYAFLFISLVLATINKKKFDYILVCLGAVTVITLVKFLITNEFTLSNLITNIVNNEFLGIFGSLGASLVSSIIIAVSEYTTGFISLATIIFITIRIIESGHTGIEIISSIAISSIFIIFGVYLKWRVNKKEELQLLLLHSLALKMSCSDGTQFLSANLNGVDFIGANLEYANFKNAKINNCNFKQAKNHHLALTDGTPLSLRKVRDLVIDDIITDKNFAFLDLNGLDFSGLDLRDFDFSHANLFGANLSHTQLTGAILEGWAIDTETRLDDIDCRYYYYLENGAKKRMPPEGEEYSAGEFSRIFQKIANTIDFIAHNEMELAAIKLSVEQVRVESDNDDIRVQAIEEKDGFIVVKVTVPSAEDKGGLYHKVNSLKQEYENKIKALMDERKVRINSIEYLKEELTRQREELISTIINKSIITDNYSINGITKVD